MKEIVNQSEKYFAISSIVDQCCIDLSLPTDKFFNKLLSWGLWSYAQIKLDTDYQAKTESLTVSDVNTVRLPVDCVAITKIGIPTGQYVRTLSVCPELSAQERLPNSPEFSYHAPPGTLPNGIDVGGYGGTYVFNNYGGRTLWGVSGHLPNRGHYKLVRRQNGEQELLLDAGLASTQIYVEYISLGINPCGSTICHPFLADYVRKSIHHEYQKFLRGPEHSEAAIQRTGRDLWDAEKIVRGRTSNLGKNELLMILRKYYRLTPHI